jgi:flagellar hook-associated protein 3 FlgL
MRITPQMIVDSTLNNMEQNQSRLEQLQNQVTSGSRIVKPSDDPIGVARALNLQDGIAQSEQYQRNINQATAWLNTTDSALDAVTQALQRARELNVQAATGTLSASDQAAIQAEISELQKHVLDLASTKFGAYYVFSGTASDKAGYTAAAPSGSGSYQGNAAQVLREVAPGVTVAVSADAQQTFDPLFTALQTLQSGLASSNNTTIESALGQFDTALDAVNVTRAQMGARVNRLEFLQQRQSSIEVSLTGLLSETKDVDMVQAISNFTLAQTVYQASLKAGAQTMQATLLDYLK